MNRYALLGKDKNGQTHRLTYVYAEKAEDVPQAARNKLQGRPGGRHQILIRWEKDGCLFTFDPPTEAHNG